MDDQLETREDAIRFLRAAGFHAFARDWSLGESIGVASHPSDSEGLVVWERMVYIAPEPGGWALYNLRRPAAFPTELLPLRDACELAITALKEEVVPEVPRRSSPTSPATDANDAVEDGLQTADQNDGVTPTTETMTWYITIRSDPGYSKTADPGPLTTFLVSLPELTQTGVNTFGNAPGSPWVRLILAMSNDGSYADEAQPHAAINLIDVLCGCQHDAAWYDSLARRIATFLDWEAVDEHAGRTLRSGGTAG